MQKVSRVNHNYEIHTKVIEQTWEFATPAKN